MELFWKNDKWNYKITMKGKDNHGKLVTKVYKTIDITADMSSDLRGRATRVYEAYDVENPGSRVVIKDSWVDANRPKEADTLSEILEDASDDEKELFLTVLVHGVVTIDGREDLTQDLIMNGYMVSTDDSRSGPRNVVSHPSREDSIKDREYLFNVMQDMMAVAKIAGRSAGDTAQVDRTFKASIFDITRAPKSGSQPRSLTTSPDVSTSKKAQIPPRVYGPKAHYRMVFEEKGQSLHIMSRQRQIKLPLVVQAMLDILKGSMILSDSASEFF